MKNIDIFTDFYPHLDLHGEYQTTIFTLVDEFIRDNKKLHQAFIVIIHGKGEYKLKDKLFEILARDKRVKNYKLLPNLGSTLVELILDN